MIDGFNKIIILDKNREEIADLENAFVVKEDERINTLSYIGFTLPYNDPKNRYCEPLNYVRNPGGELYRIMMDGKTITETGEWEYRCEHVFATLGDKTIQRPFTIGGAGAGGTTAAVIRQLLALQEVRNWVLGRCDFDFNFEYGFMGESLLAAILDVPHHFVAPFQWTFDTNRYPFVLNLIRLNPDADPDMYVEQGKNRIRATRRRDQTTVVTRLFCYGYGEYPNRLTIADVNGGIEYLQSPPHIFDRYPNAIERTFTDRRFRNPQSLKEVGQAILDESQTPFEEYEVDLIQLDGDPFSTPRLGGLVEIVGFKKTFITGIKWNHDEGRGVKLTLANRTRDIADEVLQLRNRVRIESTYAQGVTVPIQLYNGENATPTRAAFLPFFVFEDMRIINFIWLEVTVRPFEINVANRRTEQPNTDRTGLMTAGHNTGWHNVSLTFSSGSMPSLTFNAGTMPTLSGGQLPNLTGRSLPSFTASPARLTGSVQLRRPSVQLQNINGFPLASLSAGAWGNDQQLQNGIRDLSLDNTLAVDGGGGTFLAGSLGTFTQGSLPAITPGTPPSASLTQGTPPSATLNSGNHTHSMADHQHFFPHTHQLDPGIQGVGNPESFTIRINGQDRQTVQGRTFSGRAEQWMTGAGGDIVRNFNHRFEIVPNVPAYVQITLRGRGMFMAEREFLE